jgi:hypothetical protein
MVCHVLRVSRSPTGLPGLDRRLLIGAHDEVSLAGQRLSALEEGQNGDRAYQEARIGGRLPAVLLPGLDPARSEPALDGRA